MPSEADETQILNHQYYEKKQKIAKALSEAMRNHPPLKKDIHTILNELKEAFPELQALKGPMSRLPEVITRPWFEMLPIYDIFTTVERNLKKKPFTSARAREVFAYVLWLTFDLLFKNDILDLSAKQKVPEEGEQTRRVIRAELIQFNIRATNALFKKVTGSKGALILREDVPGFFTKLPTPCVGSKDFPAKIQSLGSIFEVDLRQLRTLVTKANLHWGSIKLVEKWLEEKEVPDYKQMVDVWKNIIRLRKAPPTHAEMSDDVIEALTFFGEQFPIDFTLLWDSILDRFLESLMKFQEILDSLKKQNPN